MEHVYIHLPFCRHICSYCDFCKILYSLNYTEQYLVALENEIKEYYTNEVIKTIYLGGGTPSVLSINELEHLFKIISLFEQATDCEITFECNPDDLTEALIDLLKASGVNRLSIGVQSFNPQKLSFMERTCNFDDLSAKYNLIKSKGINNINLDLMYGIPGETFKDLRKDLNLLLKLNPEHISTYSLIIEDHTKVKIAGTNPLPEELEAKMYDYIVKRLKQKGYRHYEVSNFAKPNHESSHNLAYWNNREYYGFGLGAAGFINGFRYENTKSINDYLAGKYRHGESLISRQEMMEYEVMLGLRKMSGINMQAFYDKYETKIEEAFPVKPLLKNKDLIYKNGFIYLNPKKIYLMNEILLKLL